MTPKAVVIRVLVGWIGGMVLGGVFGTLLGVLSPDFVIGLFGFALDPVRTGLGLGLVNGGIFGIIIAILVVLVEAFGKK